MSLEIAHAYIHTISFSVLNLSLSFSFVSHFLYKCNICTYLQTHIYKCMCVCSFWLVMHWFNTDKVTVKLTLIRTFILFYFHYFSSVKYIKRNKPNWVSEFIRNRLFISSIRIIKFNDNFLLLSLCFIHIFIFCSLTLVGSNFVFISTSVFKFHYKILYLFNFCNFSCLSLFVIINFYYLCFYLP